MNKLELLKDADITLNTDGDETFSVVQDGQVVTGWHNLKRPLAMGQAIASKRCNPSIEFGVFDHVTQVLTPVEFGAAK